MLNGATPGERLSQYIAEFETPHGYSTVPGADVLRRFLTPGGRMRAKQVATNLLSPVSHLSVVLGAVRASPLYLHLGCGTNHLDGWVNIDLVGAHSDLAWDIRRPLPFRQGTVDAIFLEHVFEHMTYGTVLKVLEQAKRGLASGGVLRVGVPDAGKSAIEYAENPDGYGDRPTPMLALRQVFQEHGHVTAWDGPTLLSILDYAGFPGAQLSKAGQSALIDVAPDDPGRWEESVYAEVERL